MNPVEYKKNQVEYWMMKKRMMVYEEYKQDNHKYERDEQSVLISIE